MNKFECIYCGYNSINQQFHASHIRKYHKPKQIFNKLSFENIKENNNIDISLLKDQIILNIFSNGRIKPNFSNIDFIIKNNFMDLISNIKYYTSFLDEKVELKFRIFCILNNINSYPICECGEIITKFNKSFNLYCSQSCSNKFTNYKKSKDFYLEVSKKIVETRRNNNSYKPCEAFRNYLKDPNNYNNFKNKCFEKYGIYNPGVLGAYSSKSAEKFIKNYIKENNIVENRCYFKGGGINGKEYFKSISLNGKKIYMSYDLVVLDDNNKIELVLEYNGPWHYKYDDIVDDKFSPATPYINSKTKIDTYNFDILKLNTIFVECKNIFIYWEKEKKIEKYDGKL